MRETDLKTAFRNAMLYNVNASRKEAFGYFLAEMKRDPLYLIALAEDYFYRHAASRWPVRHGPSVVLGPVSPPSPPKPDKSPTPPSDRGSKEIPFMPKGPTIVGPRPPRPPSKETEDLQEQELTTLKARLLMNLRLPNGVLMREATKTDLVAAGGFYAEVARHMKGAEVVDKKFTEDDLRRIYSRFDRKWKQSTTENRAAL